jgi:hypothetical protein
LLPTERRKLVPIIYSIVFAGAALLIPIVVLARALLNLRSHYYISYVEGAWLSLAADFSHGVLYRPLFGPLGYGGTRFFPLYFVLTSLVARRGLSLEISGLLLSLTSVLLLAAGCYFLLRRLSVSVLFSLAAVAAVLVAGTTQDAILRTKSDGLAAMLNIWGLALCVGPKPRRGLFFASAALFTLAFAAKLTTVFGLLAVIVYWLSTRRHKEAWQLGLFTGFGYALVLSAIFWGSGGRAFDIFRACAASGARFSSVLYGPFKLAGVAFEGDPVMLLFLIPCAALTIAYIREPAIRLLAIYFAAVVLVTSVIFGSPGTYINHLLDLHVASVLLLTLMISCFPAVKEFGTGIVALSLLAGSVPTMHDLRNDVAIPPISERAHAILQPVYEDSRPVLSENPLWPLELGQTPYLSDPFMFRVVITNRPALGKNMWDMLARKGFSAVILEKDPTSATGKKWYTETHVGGEFLEDLQVNYVFSTTAGGQFVYVPKEAR